MSDAANERASTERAANNRAANNRVSQEHTTAEQAETRPEPGLAGSDVRTTQEMAALVLATLHVIPYLRLEREGELTFEAQRARLLDTMARIAGILRVDGGELRHLLLGGQTALLDDLALLRPDLMAFLVVCNASQRIELGPWYLQVDNALVSGEALIRNLLAARADADRYGVKLATVAYTPEPGAHTAQLPQILRGFGIDAIYLEHGAPVVHLPFRWEAPDGSSVLVISHDTPHRHNPLISVRDQKLSKPDGPFLWLAAADQPGSLKPVGLPYPALLSSLLLYVEALRQAIPDNLRPTLRGELRIQGKREGSYLYPGTYSARLPFKQTHAALQNRLTHTVEPWLTLAASHGTLSNADNLRVLLDQAWRKLMQNQAKPVLGGYAIDRVYDEAEVRFRAVDDLSRYIHDQTMQALPGIPHTAGTLPPKSGEQQTFVVVWNPHNWRLRQVVELTLELPDGQQPVRVTGPDGDEQPFAWQPTTRRLSLLADVLPVGYTTYTVDTGSSTPPEMLVQRSTGTTIASTGGVTLSADNTDGSLVWHYQQSAIRDLLRFVDTGDAGDVYNYSPPPEDFTEIATLVSGIQAESSPVFERLILRHRVRIAPGLRPDRRRERGLRLLELTTTATFYDHTPGLFFRTEFTNTAEDHRLRAYLRTGIQSETVLADAAFGTVARQAQVSGSLQPPGAKLEGMSSTYPMQGGCAVQGADAGMALVARGLPEFEAIQEDGQTTLALTLLRAVGWISRDDLLTRPTAIHGVRPAPGAQTLGGLTAEFGLIPTPGGDSGALLRASMGYNAPLYAMQYDAAPDKTRRSYLSIQSSKGTGGESDANGAILTAFKPPKHGKGWVLRLYNPNPESVEVEITPHVRPVYARLTTLAEDPYSIIEPNANGTLHITLPAQRLATLRVSFG